jgi:Enoyl-CoA hydratase/carnithine racemase
MQYENLILEKEGPIGILTINRPKAMNALNLKTVQEIGKAIDEIKDDDEIKVLIITGSGDKAFVAGADIFRLPGFIPGRRSLLL